jgi:protocadherin Fat 4
VYQSVRFVILDIDDNPPIFKSTPYKVDVSENSPLNTNIFDGIEAVDIDGPLFNKFSFSLEADFEMDLFRIDKTNYVSSGHYKSSLLLANKLDYEKSKSHVVNVVARGENSMFTTTTQVVINIIDFPDRPPEFSQSPYYVKIEEELPVVIR